MRFGMRPLFVGALRALDCRVVASLLLAMTAEAVT
jgi:hypothetical protein